MGAVSFAVQGLETVNLQTDEDHFSMFFIMIIYHNIYLSCVFQFFFFSLYFEASILFGVGYISNIALHFLTF